MSKSSQGAAAVVCVKQTRPTGKDIDDERAAPVAPSSHNPPTAQTARIPSKPSVTPFRPQPPSAPYYAVIEDHRDEHGYGEYVCQHRADTEADADRLLRADPKCHHIDYWDGKTWHRSVPRPPTGAAKIRT